jgi:hypothetical protein
LQFEWRWANKENGFPNWRTVPVALQRIFDWFCACEASLEALDEELLSVKCKGELDTWTTEIFEIKADLSSWMKKNASHKTPECEPPAKASVL